jgi:hypothetical protein
VLRLVELVSVMVDSRIHLDNETHLKESQEEATTAQYMTVQGCTSALVALPSVLACV